MLPAQRKPGLWIKISIMFFVLTEYSITLVLEDIHIIYVHPKDKATTK